SSHHQSHDDFFAHDPATTEIYTLSLHDALPIFHNAAELARLDPKKDAARLGHTVGKRKRMEIIAKATELGIKVLNAGKLAPKEKDRKSTRLNSSHVKISYAVFCLKKKKKKK